MRWFYVGSRPAKCTTRLRTVFLHGTGVEPEVAFPFAMRDSSYLRFVWVDTRSSLLRCTLSTRALETKPSKLLSAALAAYSTRGPLVFSFWAFSGRVSQAQRPLRSSSRTPLARTCTRSHLRPRERERGWSWSISTGPACEAREQHTRPLHTGPGRVCTGRRRVHTVTKPEARLSSGVAAADVIESRDGH